MGNISSENIIGNVNITNQNTNEQLLEIIIEQQQTINYLITNKCKECKKKKNC